MLMAMENLACYQIVKRQSTAFRSDVKEFTGLAVMTFHGPATFVGAGKEFANGKKKQAVVQQSGDRRYSDPKSSTVRL